MRFDLGSLDLGAGEASGLDLAVPAEGFEFAGQTYEIEPSEPHVRLDVTQSIGGRHLRLRSDVVLVGPCWRCLEEARVQIGVDATEFHGDGTIGVPEDADVEDVASEYVSGDDLELGRWLRDAIAEALPPTLECGRDDCAEPSGAELAPEGEIDPRWAPLEELAERLRSDDG